ncbi:MAG: SMEK domain-containing protein [Spirochaetia bacterium]|nr:SMEK domain-containing protein [Spirochaetia bacterium]
MNKLYSWNLQNLNTNVHNVEAIDLVDHEHKIIAQVSATSTKEKINSSLSKDILSKHKNYTFIFISISKDASALRKNTYNNVHLVNFDPSKDIYDIVSILKQVNALTINPLKDLYQFIKGELGNEVDSVKLESNLSIIIDILSKEDWDINESSDAINTFEIDRKIEFNQLNEVKSIIDDYKIHYSRVNRIYTQFDIMGKNKSSSVLGTIRREYLKALSINDADILFLTVSENVQQKTIGSANFKPIPIDELELCINILVVDAFVRCKIFKNPQDYKYANT